MVRLQIGKNTQIKHKSLGSVHHKSLGRNLHNHCITTGLNHLCKIFLQNIRLRCCVKRRDFLLTDNGFNGAHQTNLHTGIFQNGFHHIGGRSFAFGSCDTDDLHFIGRMIKISRRNKSHGIAGIFYFNYGYITALRRLYILGYHKADSTFFNHFRCHRVTVKISAFNADKKCSRRYLTGIIAHCSNFSVYTAAYTLICKLF